MKKIKYFALILAIAAISACTQAPQKKQPDAKEAIPSTGSFGEVMNTSTALPASDLPAAYTGSDTLEVMISGIISASCRHSGCWMELDMGNDRNVHVTFKDEEFTIPLDAAGKHAVAQGMAVRQQIPVETLRNYAREDGKSEEEIALITEPEWTYELIATGVLIEE